MTRPLGFTSFAMAEASSGSASPEPVSAAAPMPAPELVSAPEPVSAAEPVSMSDGEWTAQIGRHRRVRGAEFSTSDLAHACLPLMQDLREQVPGVNSVVLGTGDGMHVCSIGLRDSLDASRITALNSSMFGVAAAHAKIIDPILGSEHNTSVIVELPGDNLMALTKIEHEPIGHLVMGIFASSTQMGMLAHHARSFSASLSEWLSEN